MYIPVGLENSPYRGLCGPNLLIEVGSYDYRAHTLVAQQIFDNVETHSKYQFICHFTGIFSGGWYIFKRCMQHLGYHKRLTTDCGHKYRMHCTASFTKSQTSDDVTPSTWHLEWTRWASGILNHILIKKFGLIQMVNWWWIFFFQIEIDLDAEHRYHSIFACPILRQQSSEENPPMKLVCGHVISRDALDKLRNGPTWVSYFSSLLYTNWCIIGLSGR